MNRILSFLPKYIIGIFYIVFLFTNLVAQDSIVSVDTNNLRVVFAGDIMGHDSQIEGAYDSASKSYNYEPTFRYIKDYLISADIAIGNLEVTLAGPPYKGYPQFSSPDQLAIEAQKSGFDVFVTANNHALDRREKGFLRTLDILDTLNIFRAGTYRDSLERASYHPLILEKNNIRLALLNYTYGTNGLKIPAPREINRIDTAIIRKELEKAVETNPDFTIVIIHWGSEYERNENKTQTNLAMFMLKHGADAIIGSHPHVIQPIKYFYLDEDSLISKPVVFSMGNFVSNQRAQYKDGGIVAELQLTKVGDTAQIKDVSYLPYWVWRQDNSSGKSTFHVLPVAFYEQNPDSLDLTPNDIYKLKRFAKDTRSHLKISKESDFYE